MPYDQTTQRLQSQRHREAILRHCRIIVDQWDRHDIFRQTEADKALHDPAVGEPYDVAIARAYLDIVEE